MRTLVWTAGRRGNARKEFGDMPGIERDQRDPKSRVESYLDMKTQIQSLLESFSHYLLCFSRVDSNVCFGQPLPSPLGWRSL